MEIDQLMTAASELPKLLEVAAAQSIAHLADGCLIMVGDDDRIERRIEVRHRVPQREQTMRELLKHADVEEWLASCLSEGLESGLSWGGSTTMTVPHDAPEPADTRDTLWLELRSGLSMRLRAGGRTVGSLSLFYSEADGEPGLEARSRAADFALHLALMVDNLLLADISRDAIRTNEEFLSFAAHELKSPIAALMLQVQVMQRIRGNGSAGLSPERLRSGLETIERQSRRLVAMINRLLDISRIAAGRLQLDRSELDLVRLVHDVIEQMSDPISQASTAIMVTELPSIPGNWDRSRLEQLVTNLLSNALRHGEGKPIEVRLEADEATARMSVVDDGVGIPIERQRRLFRRFFRASEDRSHGLGLGLFVVHEIARAHGGTVRVDSRPGEGATFIVELPRGPATGGNSPG